MAKIKIATDSTADIPVSLREELDIAVLPVMIIDGDKQYKDGYDLTPEEFYEILEKSEKLPTTSRVNPIEYTELYEKTLGEGYTDLIMVTLNAKGSATWQSAVMARDEFYEENEGAKEKLNIHIIDSTTYSMVYGWPVIEAARRAKEGASVDEIIAEINDWLQNAVPLFLPMTLQYVKKSGRVSAAAAFVGDALGLKPIITFADGESKIVTKIRGDKKAIKELVEMAKKDRKPGTPYLIVYGKDMESYQKLYDLCVENLDMPPAITYPVGCVIGINTGPELVAIIYRK